jgi:hypothetical protein
MSKQVINIGTAPNTGTGDPLRTAMDICNDNFTELYDAEALNTAKVTNATHTGDVSGSTALTLATVNANVGSFTNANITVNAKGLITSASSGVGGGGDMVYPGAGIALSSGSAWGSSITNNSTNWNTAYSWGNHASSGYLVSSTHLATYNHANIANGETAYGWGNHATAGYLTSQTSHADVVVDGDFTSNGILKRTASGVYGIVTDNSTNWNTAYGWGNHAGLYLGLTATAAKATILATARTINGVSFNGSANITVPSDITPGTPGNILTSTGTVWVSAPSAGDVTTTGTQTLTNKTLTLPRINENIDVLSTSTELNILHNIEPNLVYIGDIAVLRDEKSGALTDNTPTDAELTSAIGFAASTITAGYKVTVKDTSGSGLLYFVESDGTDWYYIKFTKAV